MLPNEIDPYKFRSFIKDMLPISDIYSVFRSSRLLNARETTKSISRTNQGLVVLTRRSMESVVYTPVKKLVYTSKDKRLNIDTIIPNFLEKIILDFVLLRFRRFSCCLSRQGEDVCGFYLVMYSDRNDMPKSEDALLNPSSILGNVVEVVPKIENEMFRFRDLRKFGRIDKDAGSNGKLGKDGAPKSKPLNTDELELNPIECFENISLEQKTSSFNLSGSMKDGLLEKQDQLGSEMYSVNARSAPDSSLVHEVPTASGSKSPPEDQCCIDVGNANADIYSKPYEDVRENDEEGLFDYVTGKVFDIIGNDKHNKKRNRPWKVIEGEVEESSSEDEETEEHMDALPLQEEVLEPREEASEKCAGIKSRRKSRSKKRSAKLDSNSTIKFGILKGERLEYVQKMVKPVSIAKFDELEDFIAMLAKCLRKSSVNYVEVCSETDFFVVKRDSTCLYVRDLVHRKEGKLLRRFNGMAEWFSTGAK